MDPLRAQQGGTHAKKVNTFFLVVSLLGTGGLGAAACQREEADAPRPPAMQAVRATAVRVQAVREALPYIGTLRATQEVQVLAQVAGTVAALPVPEGGYAQKGARLAWIHAPDVQARIGRTEAELARARIERDYACRQLETDRKLADVGAVPEERADLTRKACDAASAAVAAGEAGQAEAMAVGDRALERAPFDGQVLRWLVEPGQRVAPGRPLLELGSRAREVRVLVAESDLSRGIRVGTKALVEVAPGREVRRAVTSVAPSTLPQSRSVELHIALEADDVSHLAVGATLDVELVLAEEPSAVTVPKTALRRTKSGNAGQAGTSVLVLEGERVKEISVTRGLQEGGWVSVLPPLAPGTHVVTSGVQTVDPSLPVYAVIEGETP